MKNEKQKPSPKAVKRTWKTPRVETSEVFNQAALACCVDIDNIPQGSAGTGLPFCN